MYLPFFRCKQYELLAIRESIHILKDGDIIPILEPVRENLAPLKKCLKVLHKENIKFILIVNPLVGELGKSSQIIQNEIIDEELIDDVNCFLGFIVGDNTENSQIRRFLDGNTNHKKCLIHLYSMENCDPLKKMIQSADLKFNIFDLDECGEQYIARLETNNNIALRDDFRIKSKNANYPPDEYFSDLCFTYGSKGFMGYSDFLIVGKEHTETGGPAHVVTIHLTYSSGQREIRIKHFSSYTDSELPINPGGKYLEALNKLKQFLDGSGSSFNLEPQHYTAAQEFIRLFNEQHYPGLGASKKISMKHHMELMKKII
jgi:hypothetical protein